MANDKLSSDGLRYRSKKAGSDFVSSHGGDNYYAKAIFSCLLCGKHKGVDQGRKLKYFGKSQFVCFSCKPDKIADGTTNVT